MRAVANLLDNDTCGDKATVRCGDGVILFKKEAAVVSDDALEMGKWRRHWCFV